MEPEPEFLEHLLVAVIVIALTAIPINRWLHRRSLERRQKREEELQLETMRYVTEQQHEWENRPRNSSAEWNA